MKTTNLAYRKQPSVRAYLFVHSETTFVLHSSNLWVYHDEQTMLPCAVVHLIQTGTIVVGADAVRCLCLCICCEKILLFVLLRYEYCLLRVDHAHYEVLVYSRTSYIA